MQRSRNFPGLRSEGVIRALAFRAIAPEAGPKLAGPFSGALPYNSFELGDALRIAQDTRKILRKPSTPNLKLKSPKP